MTDPIFDRASTYEDTDGSIVYRASSFGYCIGALVRSRLGMTASSPPDFMLDRYQEGHDWEHEVLLAGLGVDWVEVTKDSELGRFGQIVEGRNGERQVETELRWTVGGVDRVVRCHPDAIVRHGSDKHLRVAEVKFLAESRVQEIARGDGMAALGSSYAWQASIEMLTTQLPMLYIIGGKDVKVDGDEHEVVGIGSVLTLEFDQPLYSFRDVKMRVAEVEGWVARGEMPPCVVPFDYPCGYWQDHEQVEKQEIKDGILVHLLESYARNTSKGEAVATEREAIRADIDARLGELGIKAGVCAGWNVSVTDNRPGNVSWKKAYDALAKQTKSSVDVEMYRGAEVLGGVRLEKVKGA